MSRLVRFVAFRPDQNRAALYTPLIPHPPNQNLYRPPSQFPHHTREQCVQARKERKERKKLKKAHRHSKDTASKRLRREQRKGAGLAIFNRNNPEDGGKDHHKESPSRTRRALEKKAEGKVFRSDTPLRWTTGWDATEEDYQWVRIDRNPPTTPPWDAIHPLLWKAVKTTCVIPLGLKYKLYASRQGRYVPLRILPGERRPCFCSSTCLGPDRHKPRRDVPDLARWVRAAARRQAPGQEALATGTFAVSPNPTCPITA
jgi:hypothetical protein